MLDEFLALHGTSREAVATMDAFQLAIKLQLTMQIAEKLYAQLHGESLQYKPGDGSSPLDAILSRQLGRGCCTVIAGELWETQQVVDLILMRGLRAVIVTQRGLNPQRLSKHLSASQLRQIHILKLASPNLIQQHQGLISGKLAETLADVLILDLPGAIRGAMNELRVALEAFRVARAALFLCTDLVDQGQALPGQSLHFPMLGSAEPVLFCAPIVRQAAACNAVSAIQTRMNQNTYQIVGRGSVFVAGERRLEALASQRLVCAREQEGLRVTGVGDWCGQLLIKDH